MDVNFDSALDNPSLSCWIKMKNIITLLLVLLFASCGKKEVYEFEISTKYKRSKHIDYNATKYLEWKKENPDTPDWLIPMESFATKTANYEMTNNSLIKFFPTDENGICFYQIESDYTEKKLDGAEAIIRRPYIKNIDFYDKHSNKLFSFPFDDNNVTNQKYHSYIKGKTSIVSRELLERIDNKKIQLSFSFGIFPKS